MVKPHPVGAEVERSLQCQGRRRVLIMLSSLTEAHPRQLAKACGIDCTRLDWIMRGNPPKYSELRSLLALGLAVEIESIYGRKFVITEKGRRKARMLAARGRRFAPSPAAGAPVFVKTIPVVEAAAAAPAPKPTASFGWQVHLHLQ